MKRFLPTIALAIALAGHSSSAAPLAVGTVSNDVGFSRAGGYSGSNYRTLTQEHASDYPETVLALIFATPW